MLERYLIEHCSPTLASVVYLVFCTGGNARAAGTVLESGITGEGDFTCCPESTESEGTDVCMSQTETAGAAR